MLWSTISFGQIVANNQYINLGSAGGSLNLLASVTLGGLTVNDSQLAFTLVNSNNNGVILTDNTVFVQQGLNSGIYTLTYQVCEIANPNNCATAVVTVNICVLPYLIITLIDSDCSNLGNFSIVNMPYGEWTLTINGNYVIHGTGTSYIFYPQSYPQESYFFEVTDSNGCSVNSGASYALQQQFLPLTILPQTCASPASNITLTDLPTDNWTLYYHRLNSPTVSVSGSGTSYTLTGITQGTYCFTVFNNMGCGSEEVCQYVGNILTATLPGTLSGSYVDYNNDGLTNLGDIVQFTLGVTNNSNCLIDNLTYNIPNAPYTSETFKNIANGTTVYFSIIYVLTQNDINNASVPQWVTINGSSNGFTFIRNIGNQTPIPLTISDGVKLNAFFDTNNDGVQNNTEQDAVLGNFVYQVNNDGINHTLYSQDGSNLLYESNPNNTYDLSYNIYENCNGQYNVSNISFNDISIPVGSGITAYKVLLVKMFKYIFIHGEHHLALDLIIPIYSFIKTMATKLWLQER